MSVGIKETKELIKFATDLAEGISGALEDGEWSFSDIGKFLPAAQSAFAGISGIDEVLAELKDLDEDEKLELEEFVITEFDIAQEDAEIYVEKAISLILNLWFFIKDFFIVDESEEPDVEE